MGVFAQDYSPLEIVLSDDCSDDKTFELLEGLAQDYAGPHQIKLRRERENVGLIEHCNSIFNNFSGEYLFFAAGDDISLPDRVSTIMPAFLNQGAWLVHSKVIYIDGSGVRQAKGRKKVPLFWRTNDPSYAASEMALYIGATGSISKKLIEKFGGIEYKDAYEDSVLGFRAALEKRVAFIDKPLVKYRYGHNGAITGGNKVLNRQGKEKIFLRRVAIFRQRLDDLRLFPRETHLRRIITTELVVAEYNLARAKGIREVLIGALNSPLRYVYLCFYLFKKKITSSRKSSSRLE